MNIEQIKTSRDVYKFMTENIEYGWLDYNGEKHIRTMKDFRRMYRTLSIDQILDVKLGTCIDQVY